MKSKRLGMVLVAGVAILLSGLLSSDSMGNAAGGPTKVAVVDVQKMFDNLDEKMTIEADRQKQVAVVEDGKNARVKEINQLQEDLKILPAGTPASESKQDELLEKSAQLQAWMNIQQQKLQRDIAVRLQAVEEKMQTTIAQVAQDNQIDMVVNKETTLKLPTGGQQTANFNVRIVLWAAPDLDITDQVVQRMNNDFRNVPK